ncbi:MAG: hypothetical protein RLZZ15_2505, partial [Verrucomicrobiota bacterium]
MKPRALLLFAALLAALIAPARAAEGRFSHAITPVEFVEAGLKKLSSDQLASIDALVRREGARTVVLGRAESSATGAKSPGFSQRLLPSERDAAGLALLGETELARLDALVERRLAPPPTTTLLAPPIFAPNAPQARAIERAGERR